MASAELQTDGSNVLPQVECPRCQLQLNARLHQITSTDAQECPRCWGLEKIEVAMFVVGETPLQDRGAA